MTALGRNWSARVSIDQLAFPDDALAPGDEPGSSAAHVRRFAGVPEPHDVYGRAAALYLDAGWRGVLPLPPGKKWPPPGGGSGEEHWTGHGAPYPDRSTVTTWAIMDPRSNVALRMEPATIGIDVDNYGVKRGGETLVKLGAKLGLLPPTWRSSARGLGAVSGIYLFAVPEGRRWVGGLPDIEIIQPGHRYAVVWPSTNPDAAGARYEWYAPDGSLSFGRPPRVDELPALPSPWVEALTRDGEHVQGAAMAPTEVNEWLLASRAYDQELCGKLRHHVERSVRELHSGRGSRHDHLVNATRAAVAFIGEGHQGGRRALAALREAWFAAVAKPGAMQRTEDVARREFVSAIAGAVKLAAVRHPKPETADPDCLDWSDLPEWAGPVATVSPVRPLVAMPAPVVEEAGGASHIGGSIRGPSGADIETDGSEPTTGGDTPTEPPAVDVYTPSAGPDRPALDVSNAAMAADWLRERIGRGRLAGIFKRGDASTIVHTPAIGEEGYRHLGDERDDDGPAQVQPFRVDELAARLSFTYACYRQREVTEKDEESGERSKVAKRSPALFPLDSARTVLAAPDMLPNVRRLAGVVHTPAVRKDGSLLSTPGYDAASRLLFLPEPGLSVPPVSAEPTAAEVGISRDMLLDLVADFPFVTDHDRAAYLGLLLTPLLRDLAPAPYKMFAISAHQAGSGKTLLATLARIIHGGVFRAEMPEDDAELRKQVTTILNMTTGPVVHIDNVTGVVRSSTLAGLLTSAAWDDRKLGANDLARCVNDRVWTLTGNNMALGGDLLRRTIWINIDPGRPDPQLRSEFKIMDIEGHVRRERGRYLAALLTLVRLWVAAGRPGERMSSDGYGSWLYAVNGILGVAGIPGRCDAPEARGQAEGEDDDDWGHFLLALERIFGEAPWTAKDVLAKVDTHPTVSPFPGIVAQSQPLELSDLPRELAEKLMKLPNGSGPAMLGRSLGKWLANRRGRWASNLTVREAGGNKTAKLWRIERYKGN
jgi:hypothetical protein